MVGCFAQMIGPDGQPDSQEEVDGQHNIGESDHQSDTNDVEYGNFNEYFYRFVKLLKVFN